MNFQVRLYKLFVVIGVALFLAVSLVWSGNRSDQRQPRPNGMGAGQLAGQPGFKRLLSGSEVRSETVSRRRTARRGDAPLSSMPGALPELSLRSTSATEIGALSESASATVSEAQGIALSGIEERESEDLDEREARPDKPDEALRFRHLQMQDENGNIPADGLQRAVEQMSLMKAAQEEQARAAGHTKGMTVAGLDPLDWTWLGPGNIGGRIRSIVIDPANANKMWVGSVGGGIWRSTDTGTTWQPVNDFLANLAVSTMVINPTNSNIMYAGTGEGFGNVDALQGGGVFRSTDAGVSWSLLASTNPGVAPAPPGCGVGAAPCPAFWSFVNRLAISPNGTTILAATRDNNNPPLGGIARSTDGGTTWTQRTNALAYDVDFDPSNSNRAVMAEASISRFSTDGGQTWSAATITPGITTAPILPTVTNTASGRIELAYAPSNTQIVYASVDQNRLISPGNVNQGDIYLSTDGGQNYNLLNTVNPGNVFLASQGFYDNIIWVNPLNSNFVVVGGVNLYRSTDGGINWTTIATGANGSAHSDHHAIVAALGFNNTTNRTVYFGNDGGLYQASDVSTVSATSGWTNLNNNLGVTQFFGGATSASGVLFGGTQDNGTIKVQPQGTLLYDPQTWSPVAGGDGGYVAADPVDPNYLYLSYTNLTLQRSTNGGASASYIYCNPVPANPNGGQCTGTGILDAQSGPNNSNANFVAPFTLDPNNPNTMLAGGVSLWRSNDVKTATIPTWAAIKAPDPVPQPAPRPPTPNPISAIAVSATTSSLIVVGHNNGDIFVTFSGTGTTPTWNQINVAPLPARFVTRLVIDETKSPNWIYATFGGFRADNVYVTKDLGTTWTDITGTGATGLPNVPVRSLVINPANRAFLYVGTEVGIFASEDAGANWKLPNNGPSNVSVEELFFVGGELVATTHGRGMYTTKTPVFDQLKCKSGGSCGPPDCTGLWSCPCTWGGGKVPGANIDVFISCPVTLEGSITVRSLKIGEGGRLSSKPGTSGANILATGDCINSGTIDIGFGELRCKSIVNLRPDKEVGNRGVMIVGKLWATGGDVVNTGIIAAGISVACNSLSLLGEATLSANAIACLNNLTVATDAVLSAQSTDPGLAALTVHRDIQNDGRIISAGTLAIPASSTAIRTLSGTGKWQLARFSIGNPYDINGSGATVLLGNDLTLNVGGLTFFGGDSTYITTNSTLLQNDHNLTINSDVLSVGVIDLGAGTLNLNGNRFRFFDNGGRYSSLGRPGLRGTGVVNLTATGAAPYLGVGGTFKPAFHLLSGTTVAEFGISTTFEKSFTIDAGTTFNFNQGSITVNGNLTVDGVLGKTSASSITPSLRFNGGTLANNGSVTIDNVFFNPSTGLSVIQAIAGTGSWPKGQFILFGGPGSATTTTLQNDVTFNHDAIGIATGSKLDTGPFTLTLPCTTAWNTIYGKEEVTGNLRRTNLAACTGPLAFGGPFTTIQFTSGTPPTELTVKRIPGGPAGFPGAVQRTYLITPTGGSGYTATLRLHYLDSELNGNNESTMQLYRNDGTSWNAAGASARNTTDNWVEYNNVTAFSPWTMSSKTPVALPTVQFNSSSYNVNEGCTAANVTVTRTGDPMTAVTVDYATSDGTASQRTKYTVAVGTLSFAPNETSKTINVLISKNAYVEGSQTVNIMLSNPNAGSLGTPSSVVLTIIDDMSVPTNTQPVDDAATFVCQHYHDFLSREADAGGLAYWTGQITTCGSNQTCINNKRIDVFNAFFFELEFQQTGSYVYRLYRSAYGNNQPFPNPDSSNATEANKLPSYLVFARDRARVVGGANLAQGQQNLANVFVQRPEFLVKYPANLDGPSFIDAVLNTIKNDLGVDLTAQKPALLTLFNSGGRGAVMYRLADDNAQTNPVNNRAFIDAEYNRAFVATQYFGYLRRDSDIGGFLFWLGQVSSGPLRDVNKQHAMVCSFDTSAEYQQRFSAMVTHTNADCPQ